MRIRWSGLILLVLFSTTSSARAEYLDWSYSWSMVPPSITSINGLSGVVGATGFGVGTADPITAVTLSTFSTGSDTIPDDVNIAPSPYTLSITLQDNDLSLPFEVLSFTGNMFGTVSSTGVDVQNKFDKTMDSVVIGDYLFTVTLTGFQSPGVGTTGSMTALVTVEKYDGTGTGGGEPVTKTPEPSSLVLAALVVPGMMWYRARRPRPAPATQTV